MNKHIDTKSLQVKVVISFITLIVLFVLLILTSPKSQFTKGKPAYPAVLNDVFNVDTDGSTSGVLDMHGKNNIHISEQIYLHLLEIDQAANERLELLMPPMIKAAGITEQLKATEQMRWVGLMRTDVLNGNIF